jgi:hypothetical protein
MFSKLLTVLLLTGFCIILTSAASAQNDPFGKADTISLKVENIAERKWKVTAYIWNDEEIAAIYVPLKFTAGVARINIDSVSYKGTLIEDFAQLYNTVDTANQIVLLGGLPMGFDPVSAQNPPLGPGAGEIARIYVSAPGEKKLGPFAVDTATVAPNNQMMLVNKEAKTILPAFSITTKGKDKEDKKEAEAEKLK